MAAHTNSDEIDLLADVFTVGESSVLRWRGFLDVAAPVPDPVRTARDTHARLLHRRASRAASAYDFALLIGVADDRKCVVILRYYFQVALFELRSSEIELVSYQLTLNSVGLRLQDADTLFWAATCAFSTHLALWDAVAAHQDVKAGRKEVLAERPSRTDTPLQLAKGLDLHLHALHMFLLHKIYQVWKDAGPDEAIPLLNGLNRRLHLLVQALDTVVVLL
jgi:hypothetical protein